MESPGGTYPLVTNAIPLYRSQPYVNIIIENIHAIDYPNVEIIISDRHCYDDAIDVLTEHFAGDARVQIVKETDALSYAQHYNLLLSLGKGKYFRWMPHDDNYPVCCLKEKVGILESNPQYLLVNGPWHVLNAQEEVVARHPPQKGPLGRWSFETAIFTAFGDYEAHAFKGLFRREVAVQKGILLFDTSHIISPERCWEFAMTLAGQFYCLETFSYYKRYHADSTHATWRQHWRPADIFWTWFYKYQYLRILHQSLIRRLVFLLLMVPMTIRQMILAKTPRPYKRLLRRIPGRFLKRKFKQGLARF